MAVSTAEDEPEGSSGATLVRRKVESDGNEVELRRGRVPSSELDGDSAGGVCSRLPVRGLEPGVEREFGSRSDGSESRLRRTGVASSVLATRRGADVGGVGGPESSALELNWIGRSVRWFPSDGS